MTFQLRWYQRAAVDSVWDHINKGAPGNPCIEIPTGGGKSAVIATLASEAVGGGARVIVLAHVKELLQQNADALNRVCPNLDVGLYSAGLDSRDTRHSVIVAGIQSVYNKAYALGHRDLILIDECHLIQPSAEGRYNEFITAMKIINPAIKIVGLTATPYRMSSGRICGPDNILNTVSYAVGVRALIAQGYLSNLRSKRGLSLDFSEIKMQAGEFNPRETDELMRSAVNAAVGEILKHTEDRKSVLLFCTSKEHAKAVQDRINEQGGECGYVDGDSLDRAETLGDFKAGRLKYLVNINVLTTGFDAPNIDCVGLLRPTASPGLYYQMVGRGFRTAPGKTDCLILDFGGNVARHGPIDDMQIRPRHGGKFEGEPLVKTCPQCQELLKLYLTACECGYQFPKVEEKAPHDPKASEDAILSEPETYEVKDISYCRHLKKGAEDDAPATFRVDYRIGNCLFISEYVCLEHTGFARAKAEKWWALRSNEPCPATASEAMVHARGGFIAKTTQITAKQEGRFWRVLSAVIGDRPEASESLLKVDDEEIPF